MNLKSKWHVNSFFGGKSSFEGKNQVFGKKIFFTSKLHETVLACIKKSKSLAILKVWLYLQDCISCLVQRNPLSSTYVLVTRFLTRARLAAAVGPPPRLPSWALPPLPASGVGGTTSSSSVIQTEVYT